MINEIKNNIIVSCQALEHEPLHSSFIMSKMALAAKQGGAKGIRANSVSDIKAIKEEVDLPIIGIIKKDYDDSPVFITATMEEVDKLVEVGVEIIAMDATSQVRPDNIVLDDFFSAVKKKYPNQLFMADCSTIEEMIHASKIGFDFVAPTLVGYTSYTTGTKIEHDDFKIIRDTLECIDTPMIAEGNIDTPQKVNRVLELGCLSVVVGSIITRPQIITKRFVDALVK